MNELNINPNALFGTQMNFTSTTASQISGRFKYSTKISGNVQMSEIRINSLINMRTFLVHLDH